MLSYSWMPEVRKPARGVVMCGVEERKEAWSQRVVSVRGVRIPSDRRERRADQSSGGEEIEPGRRTAWPTITISSSIFFVFVFNVGVVRGI